MEKVIVMSEGRKIIILTGPESTGKTELSRKMAKKFNTVCVEEFARQYIADLNRPYNYNDILLIAEHQCKTFNDTSLPELVFFDTYLIITKIWFQWVYRKYPSWLDDEIKKTDNSLYLLCAPDIPWQPDRLRENGGENRIRLFNLYREELEAFGLKFHLVDGFGETRLMNATKIVNEYLGRNERK